MITPRMMPVNISARFFSVSATAKPCISDWISSMPQFSPSEASSGPLGSGILNQISKIRKNDHAVADAHRGDLPPGVLAEPAHEEGDEQRRGDVDAEPADERRRRPRSAPAPSAPASAGRPRRSGLFFAAGTSSARTRLISAETQMSSADVEREVARPAGRRRAQPMPRRTLSKITIAPSAKKHAAMTISALRRAKRRAGPRLPSDIPPASRAASRCLLPACLLAGDEARGLHQRDVARFFARDPVGVLLAVRARSVLNAPCSIRSFHSGVACTFLNRST